MNYFDIFIGFENPEDITEDMGNLLTAKGYERYGICGNLYNPGGDQPGGCSYMRKDKKQTGFGAGNQQYNTDKGKDTRFELPWESEDFINFLIELP